MHTEAAAKITKKDVHLCTTGPQCWSQIHTPRGLLSSVTFPNTLVSDATLVSCLGGVMRCTLRVWLKGESTDGDVTVAIRLPGLRGDVVVCLWLLSRGEVIQVVLVHQRLRRVQGVGNERGWNNTCIIWWIL